jgi:DNA-binding winged helix-turn-helix (wHTH) protein
MGKIEETIYENYKKSIFEGNYDQAKKAAELGHILKAKIDTEDFQDFDTLKVPISRFIGKYFNPFPYRYDEEQGIIELSTGVITLTGSENKLFSLFSANETKGKDVKIVTKRQISLFVWGEQRVGSTLIRISIMRLRKKIEPDAKNPQILLSIPRKGYIFLGNKVDQF